MRFIHGCTNGRVLVAKTVAAGITNTETEGTRIAVISFFGVVSSIAAPIVGCCYLYYSVHHAVLGPWIFPGVNESSEDWFS
ncbi:hypothetical protein ABL78_0609 [Leptomonas seymouri]|uniref:Uncharacterized protein n=1 Tax=Leptomonas seymouri TaxID=5684 RepID=A0A0N0P931_LEPSE|nr:hypothetical protein ABL78_0609 [Leptomonas seymouri]|eukprot:KPI90227.1 hypothetical protein ABL78_0609 [Leptomonas seymouri]